MAATKAKAKQRGRPTAYRKEHDAKVYKLALLGLTDELMAEVFDVSVQTFNTWKHKHPSFLESIKRGKDEADAEMAHSLYHRGKGYSHPETKVFQYEGGIVTYDVTKQYPPDTQAASLWLRNRQPKLWRDKVEVEHGAAEGNRLIVLGVNVPPPPADDVGG